MVVVWVELFSCNALVDANDKAPSGVADHPKRLIRCAGTGRHHAHDDTPPVLLKIDSVQFDAPGIDARLWVKNLRADRCFPARPAEI